MYGIYTSTYLLLIQYFADPASIAPMPKSKQLSLVDQYSPLITAIVSGGSILVCTAVCSIEWIVAVLLFRARD